MYLHDLIIEGYRNFVGPFEIKFNKGLNILVGENGTGKSAIIDAIRLLLLEDEFGRSGISYNDFHRPFKKGSKPSENICIISNFLDLSQKEQVAFLPWTDVDGIARLTLLVENKQNNRGWFKRTLWGGESKASMFERELFDSIDCIYLPPLRDAEVKLREGRGSRLARLLRNLNKTELGSENEHPLEKKVREFNEKLTKDKGQTIFQANELIRTKLQEAIGSVFGQDTCIQFSESNFNRIAEQLRLLFFPTFNDNASAEMFRSLEENSLGYNNLLYLASVLAELTSSAMNDSYLKILLIEEPEAHLHPQLQTRLLQYLEKTATKEGIQIIGYDTLIL